MSLIPAHRASVRCPLRADSLREDVMATRLLSVDVPNRSEKKRGAEVVFTRADGQCRYTILACKCYESWEQWGAPMEVLGDNVDAVEHWRRTNYIG